MSFAHTVSGAVACGMIVGAGSGGLFGLAIGCMEGFPFGGSILGAIGGALLVYGIGAALSWSRDGGTSYYVDSADLPIDGGNDFDVDIGGSGDAD